jgi:hypothetical protein
MLRMEALPLSQIVHADDIQIVASQTKHWTLLNECVSIKEVRAPQWKYSSKMEIWALTSTVT